MHRFLTLPTLMTFLCFLLCGCGPKDAEAVESAVSGGPPAEAAAAVATTRAAPARQDPFVRRPFAPKVDGQPVLAGISYGPFREGQGPGGAQPTPEQILEDLQILGPRWHMIRFYSSQGPAETILQTIREHKLPIKVMVGAWIAPNAPEANAAEVAGLISLANVYQDVVFAVNIGNETQVDWSGHKSSRSELIGYIRTVRAAVRQPVTTADDYNFWNKPVSHEVADEVDFLLLHAYAMWNQQQLDEAVGWTASTVAAIQAEHPDLQVVMGETGWATELNPAGSEVQYIKAPAGEAEQAVFFPAFTAWAAEAGVPYFYFEAFDEPWKGSDDPREVEKHWGLYEVDRTPKQALEGTTP